MTLKYLLDTNVLSEPLRPHPSPTLLRRLEDHAGEIATASVVWHELRFGCARLAASRRKSAIEEYLEHAVARGLAILEYGREAAEWHAAERARLAASGRTPAFPDGQIAAIAFVNDLTLVTANKTDFRAFNGLRLSTWS